MRGGLIGRRHQHDFVALGCTGLLYGELDELATRPRTLCVGRHQDVGDLGRPRCLGAFGGVVSTQAPRQHADDTTCIPATPGHQKVARQLRMGRARAMMRTPSAPP